MSARIRSAVDELRNQGFLSPTTLASLTISQQILVQTLAEEGA